LAFLGFGAGRGFAGGLVVLFGSMSRIDSHRWHGSEGDSRCDWP
jgi:hypothetical protein